MKCTAHFYKLNYDFSPEFAEAHHGGKESENNRFYDWQDELVITTDVKDIQVIENSKYTLQGERKGEAFSIDIPKMLLFHIIGEDGNITPLACSHSVVDKYEIKEEENEFILNVFLAEREPLTNPVAGVYIAIEDFPKELVD